MKISINLTDAQVKGLTEYLKETSHDINPTITKKDIEVEVRGLLDASFQSGALGDCIQQFEQLNFFMAAKQS